MSRKHGRAYYAALLRGLTDKRPGEYAGVRSYANGFNGADGYDLRKFNNWTPAQKAKLTKYARLVMESRARPHVEYRIGNAGHDAKKLERVKKQFNAPGKAPQLKVAFVPFVPPRDDPKARPVLHFDDEGITVEGRHYFKKYIPFDPIKLATDTAREVERVRNLLHDRYITLQVGLYETGNFVTTATMTEDIKKMMRKYNGTTVPKGKGVGYNPKHHDWQDWLLGLNGYHFKPGGKALDFLRDKASARAVGMKRGKSESMRRRRVVAKQEFTEWLRAWLPGKSVAQRAALQSRLMDEGRDRDLMITRRVFAEDVRRAKEASAHDEWADDEDVEDDDEDY